MKEKLVLIFSYLVLFVAIFFLIGCSAIPEYAARVELNTCEVDSGIVQNIYPYLEISFDGENVGIASSDICFSFYLFNANRDTLYHRDFEIIKQDNTQFFERFLINK